MILELIGFALMLVVMFSIVGLWGVVSAAMQLVRRQETAEASIAVLTARHHEDKRARLNAR